MTPGAVAVVVLLVFAGGCRRPSPTSEPQEQANEGDAPNGAEAIGTPVDHLGPDELLEGPIQVFGVPLPRALTVKETFVDVAYASGPVSVNALVGYFRSRLQGGRPHEGPLAATFEHARVHGKPGLELTVRITETPDGSSVEVRDSTPQPAPALPDEPSRWKQVGLTPAGRLADPSHLD
jgi:hypothetical protein